jgi:GT2 family glycosyltransferase
MITAARTSDLSLTEFAAFNRGQTLPCMRRWELPFVLFQSRLDNAMSVLDCTINPVNFRERLLELYPHTLYRHHSPIQNGRFVLPLGVPDAAFDRVICVNTLEHLLQPQRAHLISALARKLKPDGLLVLTSDYYFDSSWTNPAFLQLGVMKPDRTEVFNGWNKVTPDEWLQLCQANGLHPMADTVQSPREGDVELYLNPKPHAHATIGGVFSKALPARVAGDKKIVLGLLTWNTRDVSLDSVKAYLREAGMLERLGHHPYLCVCDNGSTDGTPEALRALEPSLELPHRFILNSDNRGNSIARNQIIDYVKEVDADYVLFMDGDIEIVPFSSFAMLRYMENCGRQLGCIGADSSGQTPQRSATTPFWFVVDGNRTETTDLVAWTQYGLFRRELFEDGIRFDEREPFDQAGWGFEDNDLAFQMEVNGYANQRFFGMVYLHRNARSSIRIMRQQGIDPAALYAKRKQYVLDKWSATPPINNGPLTYVRSVHMPL